jgi:hypothetical protein
MNFNKSTLAACVALSLAAVATQASAFSILIQPSATFSTQAGASQIDFGAGPTGPNPVVGSPGVVASGSAGGLNYTFTDGALYNLATSPNSGITARPVGSVDNFWSVGTSPASQTGPGVVNFSGAGAQYVGFLWGSVDGYNSVSYYSGATLLGSYNGSYALNPANGNQGAAGTVYFNAFATSAQKITSMVFTSGSNAFETDNFAVNAVPEPETYAMLLAGLGLMGTIVRRRNKSKSV